MNRTSSFFALLLVLTCRVAGEAPLHPQPQEIKLSETSSSLAFNAQITGQKEADEIAMTYLLSQKNLSKAKTEGKIKKIIIGERGDDAVAPYLKGLPKKSGAYRLRISGDLMVIVGHDGRGTTYALRTLEELTKKDGTFPECEITDWPDVPFRGAVEGFYGTPWSHQNRLSLIDFFGKHKLNTYIYGPKDDPYHSSPKWREPYPAEEAARIHDLAKSSAANRVDFVWAIHPGKDIKWNDEDFQNVMKKFEAMYGLGVRSFAVFFDDISGEGTKADKQAELLNRLNAEFVQKKPDVTPLVMCPTQYNKAWSGGDYLETLGNTLDKSIHIMWTGNTVISDMDRATMEWINSRIKREAYVWWNFPVTDYVRNHLLLGPVYGNGLDIKELLGGFVSNPMERAEASKIALFSVADYSWNVEKFDSEASWHAAIREVMPNASEAFEVFARHNSDLGPNTHGYRRKESENFAPVLEKFLANFRQEKSVDSPAVRAEFVKIREAPVAIRKNSQNTELIKEISPWLDAFAQLGRAGVAALDANSAMQAGKGEDAWSHLAEANEALAALDEIDRTQNQNPYQPGVKTGSLVVTPFVRELIATTNARFLGLVSGRPVFRPTAMTSTSERTSLPLMIDGNEETIFYAKEVQKSDDWFGVDLGGLHEVRRIRLVQGRNDDDHDRVHNGVLEGSVDGEKWQEIVKIGKSRIDIALDPPKKFHSVRLRVLTPGSVAKADLWTAIRSFEINPQDAATLRTDIPAFVSQPVRSGENAVSVSPSLEVHEFPAGNFLGLLLPEALEIKKFQVDLKSADPASHFSLEATSNNGKWKKLDTKTEGTTLIADDIGKASALRVRNSGRNSVSVTLAKFEIATADSAKSSDSMAALSDGDLATYAEIGKEVEISSASGEKVGTVTILATPSSKSSAQVSALVDGKAHPLGALDSALARFPLPRGTTAIRISGVSDHLKINEIVWSKK